MEAVKKNKRRCEADENDGCCKRRRNVGSNERAGQTTKLQERNVEEKHSQDRAQAWKGLDLILSIQRTDVHLHKKLELAFDFAISSPDSQMPFGDALPSRMLIFLANWIQSILVLRTATATIDPGSSQRIVPEMCVDPRCWKILHFCMKRSAQLMLSLSFSPNLLRAVAHAIRSMTGNAQVPVFFRAMSDTVLLLLSTRERFFGVSLDIWISLVSAVVNFIDTFAVSCPSKCISGHPLCFSSKILQCFSNYLKAHPKPKNVFHMFVERLLESLLNLMGNTNVTEDICKAVEDILYYGLFHPAHMDGFLSMHVTKQYIGSAYRESDFDANAIKSYHKHLFERLESLPAAKKTHIGRLLLLFSNSAKKHKKMSSAPMLEKMKVEQVSSRGQDNTNSGHMFDMFVLLTNPLMRGITMFSDIEWSEISLIDENLLLDCYFAIESIKMVLASLKEAGIYVRSEDTTEGANYIYLQKLYLAICVISVNMSYFVSAVLQKSSNVLLEKVFLIAREVVIITRYFTEIEYRVLEVDLIGMWRMILYYQALDLLVESSEGRCSLTESLRCLGGSLIRTFSDVRQVDKVIWSLSKAMRMFHSSVDNANLGSKEFRFCTSVFSHEICTLSATRLICSSDVRRALSTAILSVPEGQVGRLVHNLRLEVEESLEWLRVCFDITLTKASGETCRGLRAPCKLLGRGLSGLFTFILDSSNVTFGNCIATGTSVKELIMTIRPFMRRFVDQESNDACELYAIIFDQGTPDRKCASWVLLFYFSLYLSSKSLFHQAISMMPPGLSRKALEEIGDWASFYTAHDWRGGVKWETESYFSWIIKSAASLPVIIERVVTTCFQDNGQSCAPLSYCMSAMAIQRLTTLNRLLKALTFCQDRDACLEKYDNKSNMWTDSLLISRHEAGKLTSFLTCCLVSKAYRQKLHPVLDQVGIEDLFFSHNDTQNVNFYSITKRSLFTTLWWLLCWNIDVWASHARRKVLNKFLSILSDCSQKFLSLDIDASEAVNGGCAAAKSILCCISLKLLTDTNLHEHISLCRFLKSRFQNVIHEALMRNCSSCACSSCLTKRSDISSVCKKEFINMNGRLLVPQSANCSSILSVLHIELASICRERLATEPDYILSCKAFGGDGNQSVTRNLGYCQYLLNFLCWMPKGSIEFRYFSCYMDYILDIERVVVRCLLCNDNGVHAHNRLELWKVWVSCRRALRFIIIACSTEKMMDEKCSALFTLAENYIAILWFCKSTTEVLTQSSVFCKNETGVQNLIFSLVDHTACLISSLTCFQLRYHLLVTMRISANRCELDSMVEAMSYPDSTPPGQFNLWETFESTGISLIEEVGCLLAWLKNKNVLEELDRLFSHLSFVQGFLHGFSSVLVDTAVQNCNVKELKSVIACSHLFSESDICTSVFDDFLNYCVRLMLVNEASDVQYLCSVSGSQIGIESALTAGLCMHMTPFGIQCGVEVDINVNKGNYHAEICELKDETSMILNRAVLEKLMRGEQQELSFSLRQLLLASSVLLKLKCFISFIFSKSCLMLDHAAARSTSIVSGAVHILLSEFMKVVGTAHSLSFSCLDGCIRYLEVLGSCFPYMNAMMSRKAYTALIEIHLKAIGQCISMQGKKARLAAHEVVATSTELCSPAESMCNRLIRGPEGFVLSDIKSMFRNSFKILIQKSADLHFLSAIQALEKSLIGIQEGYNACYGISAADISGGMLSSVVPAAVDCLDLVLESTRGKRCLNLLKRHVQRLTRTLINIVVHLQGPQIFSVMMKKHVDCQVNPDPGSVVLMCIEVLSKIAGRQAIFPMDIPLVVQCLHLPTTILKHLLWIRKTKAMAFCSNASEEVGDFAFACKLDSDFLVSLFSSSCRLICTILKSRREGCMSCGSVIEDSITHLLYCLEAADPDAVDMVWSIQHALRCSGSLNRIYEEIRQQKDCLGIFSPHFLSAYIWIYCGYGPLKRGIQRQIDEALRPGVYSLIDVCSHKDLQQLHVILTEGPCRSTLSSLQRDYKLYFQYEGNV